MDIIGIGALNIDYIISMPWFPPPSARYLRQEFEPGKEEWVTNKNLTQRIDMIGTVEFDYIGPGGSAFNTLRCLAQLNLGLSIGYVGIAGVKEDERDLDLRECAAKHSIDSTWIYTSKTNPPGKCISLYWPREQSRGLRTAPGADEELASNLSDTATQDALSNYIANSKWVHLTSFVNQECLSQVVQILRKAKAINQRLIISFDPGSEYCRNPTDVVKEAIRTSDYLFLNWKEFSQLGNYEEAWQLKGGKVDEKEIAFNLFDSLHGPKLMVVLKTYYSTRFFQMFRNTIIARRFWQIPLLPFSIRDDTGAGDVFAAGFIASQFIPALSFDMRTTILFSSRLVKAKLKIVGCDAESEYQKVLDQTIEEIRIKEGSNLRDLARLSLSVILGLLLLALFNEIFHRLFSRFFPP